MKKIVFAFLLFFPLVSFSQTTGSYALDFDGSDDYVNFGASSPAYSNTMTIEAWIKTDMASTDINNNIVCWGSSDESNSANVQFRMHLGKLEFGTNISNESNWQAVSSSQYINTGSWVHVAVVKNGDNVQLYINGTADNSGTNTNSITVDRMLIGAYYNHGTVYTGDFSFGGLIDEVRIWNDARTPFEIREYMFKDAIIDASLVAYYQMSNGSGTSLTDNSGNSNAGTIVGASWVGSGCWVSPGNALDFDGSDDYIDFGTSSPPYSNTTLTIEAWIKTDNASGTRNILSWGNSITGNNHNVQIRIDGGKLTFGSDPGNAWQYVQSSQSINTGRWVHVAVVKTGNDVQIYINGVLDNSGTNTNSITVDHMVIGAYYNNGTVYTGDFSFDGLIDEVRIWNTARTATEIQDGMFSNYNGNWGGIEGMYRMNQKGTETVFIDGSSNGRNGTMTNFADPASSWVQSTTYNTWIGFTSDISTTTNWVTGSVPVSTNSVNITGGSPNTFEITSVPAAPFQCDNLNIKTNSSLTVNDGKALTVNGNLCNNGTLTINSSSSGTGSLIVDGSSSGNVTTERYVSETYWHYISAPVAGQNITSFVTNANNSIVNTPSYQFFRWDEDQNYWIIYGSTGEPEAFTDTEFGAGKGYAATRSGDGDYTFTGTIKTSAVNAPVTFNADQGAGFNLVGNPFTSSIAITEDAQADDNFLSDNAGILHASYQAIYIWQESADYEYGDNDYKVICNTGFAGQGNGSEISKDYIQPGQAFMVKAKQAGNIIFNTDIRKHGTADFYKSKESWPGLELRIANNEHSNSTIVAFNNNMTEGLDPSYDAAKFKGNPNLALYTKLVDDNGKDFANQVLPDQNSEDLPLRVAIPFLRSGLQTRDAGPDRGSQPLTNSRDFAIQALPDQNIEDYIIPIGVDVAESSVFEFSATQEKLDNYSLLLEDRQENTFTDLRWESYFATISESGTGRFYLHFKDATGIENPAPQNNIQIFAADGQIIIKGAKSGQISVLDVMGRIVLQQNISGSELTAIPVNLQTGVYLVMVQGSMLPTEKVFIK